MFNFHNFSKKDFLTYLDKSNRLLSNILNNLNFHNLKNKSKLLIKDKRTIIITFVVLFSVIAHLWTPAFYKESWVKEKIKNQLEQEFGLQINFDEDVRYSIFPIPNFDFKNVRLLSENKEIALIDSFRIILSFKKFFDKNKMNIQTIKIDNGKFDFYKDDLNHLVKFFDKKIYEKKLIIENSKVFLKNKYDEIYLIINLKKSKSLYDSQYIRNDLVVSGEVFNNSIILSLKNDFLFKDLLFEIDVKNMNSKFTNKLDYSQKINKGELSFSTSGRTHNTQYEFNNDYFKFFSEKKIDNQFFYSGEIKLKPFSSNININLKNIDLINLINDDSLLLEILKSNIFSNENLNYNLNISSKNISNHRNLKDLNLKINFNRNELNFDGSNLILKDILSIHVNNSEFKSKSNQQNIYSEIILSVKNSDKLFQFFQSKKNVRKKINEIQILTNYDLLNQILKIERINIDGISNNGIQNIIDDFNRKNKTFKNRIELKIFFNSVMSEL